MSIATKTGDKGTTSLMYGRRVSKIHPRVEACGTVDELNSALGLARASAPGQQIADTIFSIQKELVTLMGELATDPADRERFEKDGFGSVTNVMVDAITAIIDDLEKNRKITFKHWATPGYNTASATLDFARTVCRRAERRVVELSDTGTMVNPEIIRYLNRLSDLCWLYARWVETESEKG
ncbi:MAG TPA: cob(I)yrinic acid a,c-diamide adenosyltransferase [Chthoniobacterales bacterium]